MNKQNDQSLFYITIIVLGVFGIIALSRSRTQEQPSNDYMTKQYFDAQMKKLVSNSNNSSVTPKILEQINWEGSDG